MGAWYALVSAALLLWVALIWSSKGFANIAIKTLYGGAALYGAVMIARTWGLA